jgi:plasmid stabilization system protein ParE
MLAPAIKGLEATFDYISRDSPQNAEGVIERVWKTINSLGMLPYRFKIYQNSLTPSKIVRSVPVGNLIVYFRVDDEKHLVRILTVRDGRRRPPRPFR